MNLLAFFFKFVFLALGLKSVMAVGQKCACSEGGECDCPPGEVCVDGTCYKEGSDEAKNATEGKGNPAQASAPGG
ncbi:hypothetical protein GVAV_002827 [Gurleya vavrai]